MQKTILFLLFILNPILFKSQNISSGLYFAAHSAIKEERTSLILSPEFDASKGFTLDFDIKFRSEEHNYGYVFRIIVDNEKSFDLIANITPGKKTLNLIEGDNIYLAFDEELLKQYHGINGYISDVQSIRTVYGLFSIIKCCKTGINL